MPLVVATIFHLRFRELVSRFILTVFQRRIEQCYPSDVASMMKKLSYLDAKIRLEEAIAYRTEVRFEIMQAEADAETEIGSEE